MSVREHEPLEATLLRLKQERDEADRRYNDALTALDRALLRLPDFPDPPPAYDEHQVTPLNQAWDIGAAAPGGGGLKGRLGAFIWRIVGPPLQKQKTFNSLLVDHLNRNVAAHREAQRAIESIVPLMRDQVADLLAFHSRLLTFLQQITPYVDTTGRRAEGQALVVNGALNGLAGDLAKRWESLIAREQRFEARVSQLTGAHDELRTLIGISQQAALTVKRELERLVRPPTSDLRPPPSDLQPPTSVRATADKSGPGEAFAPALEAYKYVGFEDQFRGSQETIRARLESYLSMFDGASDVLDVGCGRGEFLDLLKARGVTARGLDLNHEMVEVCRARGLDVAESDVVTYLAGLPDGALGGLFAAQVVEHLQPGYLLRFLDVAFHKLRPGAPIVLETLNPACWTAFFDSFIRDITHVWPLHPETLRYLVLASGFSAARIEFRSPVAQQDKLQPVAADPDSPTADFTETFNANVEKLNARMFTFLDYAIVGRR
ncbi:MAG TPA: class I SAM-dependent methyltransferase [Vicinamibacterales bacterium]|nr:class I SAM-dependent methyltransferase [Vicinamibacterales bacterium]